MLGFTPNITVLLQFTFWELVYYPSDEARFPEVPDEELGRFVGVADVVGATITYKILTEKMKVITRPIVRTATKGGAHQNLQANAHAPTLAPRPVNRNLKIGQQVQPIKLDTVFMYVYLRLWLSLLAFYSVVIQ